MNHDIYKPYFRKIKKSDKGSSFRDAVRLALFEEIGGYVLVQRKTQNIMAVGKSKQSIINRLCLKDNSRKSFNQWRNRIKRWAQK